MYGYMETLFSTVRREPNSQRYARDRTGRSLSQKDENQPIHFEDMVQQKRLWWRGIQGDGKSFTIKG